MRAILAILLLVSIGSRDPAVAQPVTANDELSDAIKNLKALHMNSGKADWAGLEERARQMIAGKDQASDAYPAIYSIIVALGEKHTQLLPADSAKAMQTGTRIGRSDPPPALLPEGYMLEGQVALLKLPRELGNAAQGFRYTQVAQTFLAKFSASHACRIIIDLRGNTGGSMAPMINGVADLLGAGPYGYFLTPTGSEAAWTRENSLVESQLVAKPQSADVVAVLLDRQTASAGEFTAVAFEGRPKSRTFGEPTFGDVSTNIPHRLPDGALLAISTGWSADRLHRPYKTPIVPDEATESGQATIDRAIDWLSRQPCNSSHHD